MDWEIIYREHSPGVFQYLLNLAGRNEEAEDLLQETFIKAMRCESSLREPGKMRSWLLTISRNLFLDDCKKQNRRSTTSMETSSIDSMNHADAGRNPEEHAIHEDFRSQLKKAMTTLSEAHQTAFTLGVIQKVSYREIADITGWSSAMVKANVFRARKKIAFALNEFQG